MNVNVHFNCYGYECKSIKQCARLYADMTGETEQTIKQLGNYEGWRLLVVQIRVIPGAPQSQQASLPGRFLRPEITERARSCSPLPGHCS